MIVESIHIDIIKLANEFISENPDRSDTEFFKFLFTTHPQKFNKKNFRNRKTAQRAYEYVKNQKQANISESEWKIFDEKVYQDQDGKDNEIMKPEKRISENSDDILPLPKRQKLPLSFQDKDFTMYPIDEIFNCEEIIPFPQCLIEEMEKVIYSKSKLSEPVLLTGPKECGKTTFIKFIAKNYNYHYFYVSKYHIENMVKDNFEKALGKFGEEFEKILLHFEFNIYSAKIVGNFKYKPISASTRFLLIYESNEPETLNQLTYSRLAFPIVSKHQRQGYLEHFLSGYELESGLTFEKMGKSTPGYQIGEIKALCKMLVALVKEDKLITERMFTSHIKSDKIKLNYINTDGVSWNDIGGHDEVKTKLMNIMKDLLSETRCGTDGVILYGPPGCGKTMLAKALSNELEFTFISVACTSILNKYQGESEKNVSQIFTEARSCQPCILFIDEMDALCSERNDDNNGSRNTIVNTFLVELDGVTSHENSKLLVIGATNHMEKIDNAIKRSGRLGRHIEVKIPQDSQQRFSVLMACVKKGTGSKFETGNFENIFKEISLDKYTKDWNHSDLASVVKEAKSLMISDGNNESPNCLTLKHMLEACRIKNLEKKISNKISPEFDKFAETIFVEDLENKKENYEFNEEIMTIVDAHIAGNKSVFTVGGRKRSGKSTLIDLIAKKYNFNLVKIDQKYFKNFDLKKTLREFNQFVQKNGQTLFHIDQRLIPPHIFDEIYWSPFSNLAISGVLIIFEMDVMYKAFVLIPEFTRDELELNLRKCLQNGLIIENDRIAEYVSAVKHWTHVHFAHLNQLLSKKVPIEDYVMHSIELINGIPSTM